MGCVPKRSCSTTGAGSAPDPLHWTLLAKVEFRNAHVLRVKYPDCTNFEGVKIMVYRGAYSPRVDLDPHFTDDPHAPIARFRPDEEGWRLAIALAMSL